MRVHLLLTHAKHTKSSPLKVINLDFRQIVILVKIPNVDLFKGQAQILLQKNLLFAI